MRLEIVNVSKRYGRVQANKNILFDIKEGEVLAILGENGAGKTTLMRILYGLERLDTGHILKNGESIEISNPKDAIKLGIGMVHQHFKLVNNFTVAQNMVLGMRKSWRELISIKRINQKVENFFNRYHFSLNPSTLVGNLPVGLQQRVEIMKALYKGAEILVLDEPTAVLTPQEIKELFVIIRELTAAGKSVVFISHKLDEVLEISDRILVLRQGEVVGTCDVEETSKEALINMMIGRNLKGLKKMPVLENSKQKPLLMVDNLCISGSWGKQIRDISFTLYSHEILGVAGVDGNGQTELIEAITGLRKPESGRILIQGKNCTGFSARRIRQSGLAHIPEDRQARGLILPFDVKTNLVLMKYDKPPFSRWGVLKNAKINDYCKNLVEKYQIKTEGTACCASALSGGNQQKVVVARELEQNPDILIAVKPTRGVDIGATEYIHSCLLAERENNRGVLLVSSELEEIMTLTDRIIVLCNGKITGCVWTDEMTEDSLGALMTGVCQDFSAACCGKEHIDEAQS